MPDLWPTACEAGWPGLLIDEERGGAGLDAFDAMLVLGECGRVLAGVPSRPPPGDGDPERLAAGAEALADLATGERRAAYLPVSPPDDLGGGWSADPASGATRTAAPTAVSRTAAPASPASSAFVPDAPGADVLVGVAILDGKPVGVAIDASAAGVTVTPVERYDSTRSLGHVALKDAPASVLDAPWTHSREPGISPGPHRRRVARQRRGRTGCLGRIREGALHVRARDRLVPGDQACPDGGAPPARERPVAALLRRLGPAGLARRVPARGERGALGRGQRTGPCSTDDDLRPRRHRRDMGARRAAVLPPGPALAPSDRRHRQATDRVSGELILQADAA